MRPEGSSSAPSIARRPFASLGLLQKVSRLVPPADHAQLLASSWLPRYLASRCKCCVNNLAVLRNSSSTIIHSLSRRSSLDTPLRIYSSCGGGSPAAFGGGEDEGSRCSRLLGAGFRWLTMDESSVSSSGSESVGKSARCFPFFLPDARMVPAKNSSSDSSSGS
jgi:hypothetical protein